MSSFLMRGLNCLLVVALLGFAYAGHTQVIDSRPDNFEGFSGNFGDLGGSLTGLTLQINEPPAPDTLFWHTFDRDGNQVWLLGIFARESTRIEDLIRGRTPVLVFDIVYWVKNGVPMGSEIKLDAPPPEVVDIGLIEIGLGCKRQPKPAVICRIFKCFRFLPSLNSVT